MFHFRSRSAQKPAATLAVAAEEPTAVAGPTKAAASGGTSIAVVELLEADLRRASKRLDAAGSDTRAKVAESQAILESLGAETGALAAHTDVALEHVNTLAQGCQDLHRTAEEVGRRAETSQRLVDDAGGAAQVAARTVDELKQAIEQIQAVVSLISDVAGQTNLLALNATIEAARAGVAGRGFAVVASEVKALADQTAKATEEIAQQIIQMQTTARASVDAIEAIGSTIRTIDQITVTVAAAVEEQSASTNEIARNVSHAARATEEVDGDLRQIDHLVAGTVKSADGLLAIAEGLTERTSDLSGRVDRFLGSIRAA